MTNYRVGAFVCALIGLFISPLPLGIISLVLQSNARKNQEPSALVTAAMVISIIDLTLILILHFFTLGLI